jgi:ABC-type uncharacterized transport system substrate-binding protein
MRRVRLFLLLALAVGPPCASAAEVTLLKSSDVASWRPALDAFRKGTLSHTVTEYDLRGDRAEGERVLSAMKGRNVILVALGPLAAQVARQFLPEAPLIYGMIQDPRRVGLTGPALSGVAFSVPLKNQLAAFRLVFPRGTRVGLMSSDAKTVEEAESAGRVVRVNVVARKVASERDVPSALRSLLGGAEAVDAIWIPADPVLLGEDTRRFILAEALKRGKPVLSFSSALVAEGALASDGPDIVSVGEQLAELVNRTAGGDKTARGTMLVPRAELVINKKIAEKLRIEIPEEALRLANKVF